MNVLINLADRAILPDTIIRMGIRYLDRKRLAAENHEGGGSQPERLREHVRRVARHEQRAA